ncbi:phage tail tape measure protein [Staphylococcus delphini]|nr:phage tail tape measure protein [Staphylococcus delphini]
MAEIKGLSILMDAKDIGVQRTLQQIRGQFKTLSSEMTRSSSNFKHTEKSMQTLKQRSKELTRGIEVTENSMREISNQLKRMSEEERRTSVHAEKLRTEYSKQHRTLNMYQRQLASTDKEMKQFDMTSRRTVFSMEKINTILGTMRKQLNIANLSFERGGKSTKSYENYLKQLNVVIQKHQSTIKVLEARYKNVVREQGVMSQEALDLKQKILQEKQALSALDKQYKDTTSEAKRFSMEQRTMTMSMSQIRERITSVANALKISASNFKLSGQTAQAYKAHISELNNSMKQQQLIVQNLSRQYDYAKRQYGSTSKEAQALNLKLTEERVKLKELNSQIKETTNAHNRLEMEQRQGISSTEQIRAKMQSFNDTLSLSRSNLTHAGESVKSYKNHLSVLNGNMTQQKNVLSELNAQYKFVASTQGKNSQEARELSSAIVQQKIKINELESEIKQASTAYKQLSVEQQRAQRLSATGFGRGIQSVDKYKDSLRNVSAQMRSIGTGAFIYMTVPTVAAIGGGIKASVEWEQALAGVAKTTNMSGAELKRMGNEITSMSNKMPFAATEIAGVAESAGQLGVKKKDITAFTKTMLNMGVATNLTADEAATEFARFANAAKMPIKDVDRLGSTVTALGNTTATTEKEIVDMAQRLAGAGAQAGFSADQIMSISAAMSSAGIESEAGGTAMTQIFNKMTKAVAAGGGTLKSFAKTAGMSAEEFSTTWENNPSKALSMFVKGLSNTEGGAKGVLKALDSVGIKGVREADTIRRMANNHKLLDDALKTGAEGWKKNTALTNEAQIRYETMGSKLKVLKNTFINFLRTIGEALAPIVIKLSDSLTNLFKRLQGTSDATKIVITVFGIMAAAIPPLLIGVGLLASAITNIAGAVTILNGTKGGAAFFNLFNGGITKTLPKIGQMITKIPILGGVFTLLTGPIGLAIAAVVAIGTAFVIAYKKSETFRNIVHTVIDPVVNAFKNLWNTAKVVFSALKNLLSGNALPTVDILSKIMPKATAIKVTTTLMQIRQAFIDAFNAIWQFGQDIGLKLGQFWNQNGATIMQALTNIWNTIVTVFTEVKNFLWPILQELGGVVKTVFMNVIVPAVKIGMQIIWGVMKFLWPLIKTLIVDTWNNIKGIINGALDVILGIVKIFSGIFTGQWGKVWEGVKQVFSGALTLIWNLVQLWFVGKILKVVKIFGGFFKGVISKAFNGVKSVVGTVLKFIWSIISSIFKRILSITKSIFSSVFKFIKSIWTSIKNAVSSIVKSLWSRIKGIWNNLYSGTKSVFNRVKSWLSGIWNSIKRSVTDIASRLWGSVRRTFNNMKNGLKSIIDRIKSHIGGMVSKIKSGLNSLIKGLNWVGEKLSLPKIPTLSTGTVHNQQINRSVKTTSDGRMKQDTMAIVGDKGPGNGKGRDGRRELIQYPNGRTALTPAKDTPTIIPKGGRVISGGVRQQMTGELPRFSTGTWFGKAGSWIGSKMRSAGDWLKDRLGDVLDFVGKPSKLLNKLLSSLGIDFGSLTKGMGIVGQITRGAWNKIKDGAIKWLKGGLDSAGGDIKGGILDPRLINYHYGRTAAYTAATGRPFHEGVDFPFVYKTIRTPMGGKVARQSFMHGGYGNWVKVISGAMEMIFAHLRDFSKTPPTGKTVKAGDVIGLTGNTGFSTGPHLHFGIRKNGRDVDPEPYLWRAQRQGRLKVSGKGGGGLGRIAETVKTALNQTGLPTTKRFVDFWSKKINEKEGTGLLDISKSTFEAFKAKGYDKYNNTLDNLMAGMRYAKVNYGSGLLDKAKRFASGGLIKNSGWYNLAEGGYPEYVISTDPALYSDSMKLLALAAQDIDKGKKTGNKRPGQLPRISNSSDNTALLMQMIENQQQQINQQQEQMKVLMQIAAKELIVDESSIERMHNKHQDKRERYENKLKRYRGGAFAT